MPSATDPALVVIAVGALVLLVQLVIRGAVLAYSLMVG